MATSTDSNQTALNANAGITHFVSYTFDVNATQKDVDSVVERMLALKYECLYVDGKPYIKLLIGGTNNNPDRRNEAITHAFVSEFESAEDRNYYLHEDPVHLAFEASLSGVISRAFALDFTPSVFLPLSELEGWRA